MLKLRCVQRQYKALEQLSTDNPYRFNDTEFDYSMCFECPQGLKVRDELIESIKLMKEAQRNSHKIVIKNMPRGRTQNTGQYPEIKARIVAVRKKTGWSQNETSKVLDVGQSMISKILRGQNISAVMADKLNKGLDELCREVT